MLLMNISGLHDTWPIYLNVVIESLNFYLVLQRILVIIIACSLAHQSHAACAMFPVEIEG